MACCAQIANSFPDNDMLFLTDIRRRCRIFRPSGGLTYHLTDASAQILGIDYRSVAEELNVYSYPAVVSREIAEVALVEPLLNLEIDRW